MMNPYMWQWMQEGGRGWAGGGWMWLGFGLWSLAGLIITVEVIVLLWLWIKKLWKQVNK